MEKAEDQQAWAVRLKLDVNEFIFRMMGEKSEQDYKAEKAIIAPAQATPAQINVQMK